MNAKNLHHDRTSSTDRKRAIAGLFALCSLAALGLSIYFGCQRYLREHPPPLPNVIAPIPQAQVQSIRTGMTILAKTVLHATPQQQQQLAAIWDKPPRSIDELIQYQQRTDQVLTPDQRAKLLPIRKKVQNSIVDKMLEPARGGFGADDFEKFKKEVKARVDHRIDGQ